ncbi:hypothetical protein GCM10009559_61900 [Pseudonocardia zijingensis]|uniref:DUF397 domain-containing protein n=1 Tax=Pseudonocardia zijingensis TaxID=153376 RepID=A0ABN1N9K3_9PSEU
MGSSFHILRLPPMTDLADAVWRKSSRSNGDGGECVEVADLPDGSRAVRDSKDRLWRAHVAVHAVGVAGVRRGCEARRVRLTSSGQMSSSTGAPSGSQRTFSRTCASSRSAAGLGSRKCCHPS